MSEKKKLSTEQMGKMKVLGALISSEGLILQRSIKILC